MSLIGGTAHARWAMSSRYRLSDYYTNYYMKGQTQLVGFVTSWLVLPYPKRKISWSGARDLNPGPHGPEPWRWRVLKYPGGSASGRLNSNDAALVSFGDLL